MPTSQAVLPRIPPMLLGKRCKKFVMTRTQALIHGILRGIMDGLCPPTPPRHHKKSKRRVQAEPAVASGFARLIKKLNSQEVKVPCLGKQGKEAWRWSVKPSNPDPRTLFVLFAMLDCRQLLIQGSGRLANK